MINRIASAPATIMILYIILPLKTSSRPLAWQRLHLLFKFKFLIIGSCYLPIQRVGSHAGLACAAKNIPNALHRLSNIVVCVVHGR